MERRSWLAIIMVWSALVLGATQAGAGTISFDVWHTVSFGISDLTPVATSSVAMVSGEAYYPQEGLGGGIYKTMTGPGTLLNSSTGGPWLNYLETRVVTTDSPYKVENHFVGTAPRDSGPGSMTFGGTLGEESISQTILAFSVPVTGTYTLTLQDDYSYRYQMANTSGNRFDAVGWKLDVMLDLDPPYSFAEFAKKIFEHNYNEYLPIIDSGLQTGTVTFSLTLENLEAGDYTLAYNTYAQQGGGSSTVPLPGSILLLGSGLLGLVGWRIRKR